MATDPGDSSLTPPAAPARPPPSRSSGAAAGSRSTPLASPSRWRAPASWARAIRITCLADSREGQLKEARGHSHRAVFSARPRQHRPRLRLRARPPHHPQVHCQQRRDRRHLGRLARQARTASATRLTPPSERNGKSGKSPAKTERLGPLPRSVTRGLVAGAHRPPEGNRRLHRRQGRVRVPLRQALRGQNQGPRRRPLHRREPLPAPRPRRRRERRAHRRHRRRQTPATASSRTSPR